MLFTILCAYLIYLLLRYPVLSLEYASTGLLLWFQKMIPTLLPFMILSGVMIRMNLTERFVRLLHPLLHRLFRTSPNGSYTILMGFLCGFPMGARIVGELYQSDKLDRREAAYLLAFCNNIGPIYFLSFVVSSLHLTKPLMPFGIMYGVPLLYGFILCRASTFLQKFRKVSICRSAQRQIKTPHPSPLQTVLTAQSAEKKETASAFLPALDASVVSGLIGIARLGGYMIFFNLLNIITAPFSHLPDALLSLYNCLLEITSGIDRCGQSFALPILVLLPFGGFSCIAQTYSMIHDTDLSLGNYIFHKIMQTLLTLGVYAFCFACRAVS